MGITNLNKLIREFAPGVIQNISIEEISLWRVGIDISVVIYQLCAIGAKHNIKNKEGKYINHIQGVFYKMLKLILSDVSPAIFFDGAPPRMKDDVINARKSSRDAGTSIRVPREVFSEVAKLIALMGITGIKCISEAEAQAAVYTQMDILDAIATEDYDCLVFGAKRMIIGLDTSAKNIKIIELETLLAELKLTHAQFVDLCILCGCDYTGTLPGIGYKRAYALMRKYGSIEKILAGEKIMPRANFNYIGAREIFLRPEVSRVEIDPEIRKLTREDIKQLYDFLVTVHGLEATRVDKSLRALSTFHSI